MRDFLNSAREVFTNVKNYLKNGKQSTSTSEHTGTYSDSTATPNEVREVSSTKRRRTKKES